MEYLFMHPEVLLELILESLHGGLKVRSLVHMLLLVINILELLLLR